jgi:gliding motility-associated lipoprotein GldH
MTRTIITSLLAVFLFTACETNSIYKEYETFDDLLWKKADQPEFTFKLEKEQHVQLDIAYRLIYGYPYTNMKSKITINNETGNKHEYMQDFLVRNEDKSYKGEIMGDFIDIQEPLFMDTILPSGDYTIKVEQMVEKETLAFVMEVGVDIKDLDKK